MNWLASRIKEPSTWAGLAGLIPTGLQLAAAPNPAAIGGFVAALAAVLMKEKGSAA